MKKNALDLAFMPDTSAATLEQTPLASHAILILTTICIFTAIIWANFAEIDEVAHADGRVIPSSQIQTVQNFEGGILSEVLVSAGETVVEGQTLIRVDDARFSSSYNEGLFTSEALQARISRLQAEMNDENRTVAQA